MNNITFSLIASLLAILAAVEFSNSAPSTGSSALVYLSQYGYLGSKRSFGNNSGGLFDARSFTEAIKDFQSFAGLDVTGELDEKTLQEMELPRCGVKDKVGTGDNRAKRYAVQGSRWKVKNLTYRILKYPKNIEQKKVDKEIQKAFNVWSEYTDLTFTPSRTSAHIEIKFESGEHGDGDPFDGPGGTLAHAYFPVFGGDAHFDAAEKWSIDSYRGTNLFQVAAHEFGHSLGLSHSDVREALMAPFYRGYEADFELHEDDVEGIQALYGKKTKGSGGFDHEDDDSNFDESKTPPPANLPPSNSNLCQNPKIDTIFNSADGQTFIFKGDKYWRLTQDAVAPGYPKLIREGWPGLPGNIDAAFTYKNGKTYFFKGSQYWRYRGKKVDGDYPKEISEGFTGIPDNIDSAMVWSGNGKIYFFKGLKFWRFDPSQRPPVKSTYPKLISNWKGIPNNLDAAFQWNNGYTYFYKDNAYYRFNDREFAVDVADPAFPRSIGFWWYGCKSAPKGTIGTSESNDRFIAVNNSDAGYDALDAGDYHEQTPPPDAQKGADSGSSSLKSPVILITMTIVILKILYFITSN